MYGLEQIIRISLLLLTHIMSVEVLAQNAKFSLNDGNAAFEQKDYENAILEYSEALTVDPNYEAAEFNTANAFYRQEKMDDAVREFRRIAKSSEDKNLQAKAYHNLGNSYLQSKKLKEAIEAYKNSLRIQPDDHETRYNLAVAKKLLEEQQQNQEQNKDQNKDQNKEDNQDKKDKNDEQQENKEENQNEEKNEENNSEDKKEGEDDQKQEENQEQDGKPKEGEMTQEDAERLLQMLEDEEKETQDDLKKKKVKVRKTNIEKDW